MNTHVSGAMADLIAAPDWLTVCRLKPYAHELNRVELVWSHLKQSLASLAKRNLSQLTALVKTGSSGCCRVVRAFSDVAAGDSRYTRIIRSPLIG